MIGKKCKKIIALLAAAVMFVSAGAGALTQPDGLNYAPVTVNAAEGTSQLGKMSVKVSAGAASYNIGGHNYYWSGREINTWNWADTAKSYLALNSDGTFTRAEYIGDKLTVEVYSSAFALKSSRTLALELPIFGGVFFGSKYIFVVCGQENPDYSDDVEVVRVVKYDKSWKRLGAASFRGKNTYIPFEAGTVSMDETGGKLFIHTSHKMYADANGTNHQANLTFFVDQETMASLYENYRVWNISSGYVSHSFNQVIRTDGSYVYTVDHGDAHPRSMVLVKRQLGGGAVKNSDLLVIKGSTGANLTKATLGDMQLSSSNVLTVGVSVRQDDNYDSNTQRNVFLSVASKNDISSNSLVWLTNYAEGAGWTVANPYLVKTAADRFLFIWEEHKGDDSRIRCAVLNGSGSRVGSVYSFTEGAAEGLSDCAPILSGSSVIWYSTGSRSDSWWNQQNAAPVFYRLPADPGSVSFINITRQPQNVTVYSGDSATFSVKAEGTGLQYQWYYKKKGQTSWNKWGTRTTASTTATSNDTWNGMQVYCKITDAKGETADSTAATVTVKQRLAITQQPQNKSISLGESVTLAVKAKGEGLTYQWYFMKKGQTAWSKWNGRTHASETVTPNETWNGIRLYCFIKDSSGASTNSDTVTVTVSKTASVKITAQPQHEFLQSGNTARFTVKAIGDGLKYQWYFRKYGATGWTLWKGHTTATTTAVANDTWNKMKVLCKVTDSSGKSVNSSPACITICRESVFTISRNATITISLGESSEYKYQWYYRKSGATVWSVWNGRTSPSLTSTANDSWDGMQIHCRMYDSDGNDVSCCIDRIQFKN